MDVVHIYPQKQATIFYISRVKSCKPWTKFMAYIVKPGIEGSNLQSWEDGCPRNSRDAAETL